MRRFWLCLSGVILGSSILSAGQIYGTLRDASGKGVPGIQIVIVSAANTTYEGKTGPDGSYQIFVKEAGRCEFRASLGGKAPATAAVFSYPDPAKYEFDVTGGALKAK